MRILFSPLAAAVVLFSTTAALADDGSEIRIVTLQDGSVIRAQVPGSSGGFYTVRSATLGEMKIPVENVVSIMSATDPGAPSARPAVSATPAGSAQQAVSQTGVAGLQSALASQVRSFVSTSDGMAAVTQFSQNPDMKAVLSDPALAKAIQTGDYNALMNSPAVRRLMANPETKALIQGVLGRQLPSGSGSR
jgi:hypothetical protein